MTDVFFYEAFAEEAEQLQRFLPNSVSAGFTDRTIQESGDAHPPARVISVRTQSAIPPSWSPHIEAILTRSTGFDHIQRYFWETGQKIAAGYLPLYCNRSVAEQAMLLWMALLRQLPRQMEQFGSFHRDGITGGEAQGRTLMVAGVGNIGHEICRIGSGLGMTVLGVDIDERHDDVLYVSPHEAIQQAHVIVCSMCLTNENRHYFHYDMLRQARPGAVFVNIARGELSPPADLMRALDESILAGVALDVFDEEKELATALRQGSLPVQPTVCQTLELARRSNVIMTPHNAFNTVESVERKSRQSLEQLQHFFATGEFLWPIGRN
ncbi:NAD(P)-dependent oxidoreductase [Desulfurispira natronophila]|uniref:D-lactate dehydrogenase n=1 Tax=Desulfurispira natronophila TaxID=682562 RepID=A0A7W8DH67_9BACT|nr:NAD(P)-dependent oxidoreductase [Desulfurispira natronophila]MBB5022067.1 D-lactate dehydrogenase [Desulfurispira natronophila]